MARSTSLPLTGSASQEWDTLRRKGQRSVSPLNTGRAMERGARKRGAGEHGRGWVRSGRVSDRPAQRNARAQHRGAGVGVRVMRGIARIRAHSGAARAARRSGGASPPGGRGGRDSVSLRHETPCAYVILWAVLRAVGPISGLRDSEPACISESGCTWRYGVSRGSRRTRGGSGGIGRRRSGCCGRRRRGGGRSGRRR